MKLNESDSMFVLIEGYRYLLENTAEGFYVCHRMEDKTGYDFNVDYTFPPDYFLSHSVEDFYERVGSFQPSRDTSARKAELKALESQLKAFGWIPGGPSSSVVFVVEGRAYTITREADGSFTVVYEPEASDETDLPVSLKLPEAYFINHSVQELYYMIAKTQTVRPKHNPITSEQTALYFACRTMGWPAYRESRR